MTLQETARIDRLLETLTSVLKARVRSASEEDRLTEIHILSDASVPPKQIVRNVETLLKTAFDLGIDHRIVSIAELKPDAPLAQNGNQRETDAASAAGASTAGVTVTRAAIDASPPAAASARVVFQGIRVVPDSPLKATAHVELRMGETIFEGHFSETDTPRARMYASARAVIEALESLVEKEMAFYLAGIDTMRVSGRDVLVVLIEGCRQRDRRRMFGTATIADDPNEASVRAVLDAVNRFITRPSAGAAHG